MFIRLGDSRVINLNNVAQIAHRKDADNRPFIQIDFIGEGLYERFYSGTGSAEYAVLDVWMNETPHLLSDEK